MIDQAFRSHLPKFTGPLINFYKRLSLTPNHLTYIALSFSVLASSMTAIGFTYFAIALWWTGRLLDGTDGIYARATDQTSDFGAFNDIVCDMASYSMMIIGFYILYPDQQFDWILILFLYVLCITGALALGALEEKKNIQRSDKRGIRLTAGLAEGGETGIAYTLFLLFPSEINWLTKLWIGILVTTVVARGILAKRVL